MSASRVTPVPSVNVSTAIDTSGVGTRIALPVSFPASGGYAFATARAAPVFVGTMLSAAERPRRGPRWWLSVRFWSFVNEWTVSTCPCSIPNRSSRAASTGVTAFVVQDAAARIGSSPIAASFTPCTMFGTSPDAGAVSSTRETPGAARCADSVDRSVNAPVLSTTIASWMPCSV